MADNKITVVGTTVTVTVGGGGQIRIKTIGLLGPEGAVGPAGPIGPEGPEGPAGPAGGSTFLALTDTPADYAGAPGKVLAVNLAGDAVEYIAPPTHAQLSDLATSGHPDDVITINPAISGYTNQNDLNNYHDVQIDLREAAPTGIVSGGVVSQASATTVDVTAGVGEVVDGYTDRLLPTRLLVAWTAAAGITILMPTNIGVQIIYVDNLGTILQKAEVLTPAERRTFVQLAFVYYKDGTILAVRHAGIHSNEVGNALYDWLYHTAQSNRVDGMGINPVNNLLQVWCDNGDLVSPGVNILASITNPNIATFPAVGDATTPAAFDVVFADGTNYLLAQTTIPEAWESAPGVATALTGDDATTHYFYRTFANTFILQLGTTLYNNAALARDSLEVDRNTHAPFTGNANTLLSAQIYVGRAAGNFNSTSRAGIVSLIGSGSNASGEVTVNDYLSLTDVTSTTFLGEAGNTPVVNLAETGLEFAENGAGKLAFRVPYIVGGTYNSQDVVRDGSWTMVANKTTTDRPAPQPSNNPQWVLPDAPTWVNRSSADDISFGAMLTAVQALDVLDMRIWVADATYEYVVQVWDLAITASPVLISSTEIIAGNAVGWLGVDVNLDLIVSGGVYLFSCVARNPAADASYTDVWSYSNQTPPGAGIINQVSATEIRINNTSGSAGSTTDRSADLLLLKLNDRFRLEAVSSNSRYTDFLVTGSAVNSGAYVTLPVEILAQGDSILNNSDVTVDWIVSAPTAVAYNELTNFYAGSPNISGYLNTDVGNPDTPTFDDNSYGIDLHTDTYTASLDWDVLATSSAGGGSISPAWGAITGVLSNQTDLQAALDNKLALDGTSTMVGDLVLSSSTPRILFSEADGALDEKNYDAVTTPTSLLFRALSDDELTQVPFWEIKRLGTTVISQTFSADVIFMEGVLTSNAPLSPTTEAFVFDTVNAISSNEKSFLSFKVQGVNLFDFTLNPGKSYGQLRVLDTETVPNNFFFGYNSTFTNYAGMFNDFGDFWLGVAGDATTRVNFFNGAKIEMGSSSNTLNIEMRLNDFAGLKLFGSAGTASIVSRAGLGLHWRFGSMGHDTTFPLYFGDNNEAGLRYNGTDLVISPKMVGTGVLIVEAPVAVESSLVAGLPSAAIPAQIIYVSDEVGGSILAFSDGVNWRRSTDRAIVS